MKKNACRLVALVLGLLCSWQVYAADSCETHGGKKAALSPADAQFLQSAMTIIDNKDRKAFLALTGRDLLFVRIFMESPRSRGGDLSLTLKPEQIDKELKFHVKGQIPLGDWQVIKPVLDGTGVFIDHPVCEGAAKCERVPSIGEQLPFLYSVLGCNGDKNGVFVFTDGILLTAMEGLGPDQYLNGTAYFFARTPSGYRLSALVTLQ